MLTQSSLDPIFHPVTPKLSRVIDARNLEFTDEMKRRLRQPSLFSEADLSWLMLEHYQFSARNPSFLATAAANTEACEDEAVSLELYRNFNEEKSHAAMYRRALKDIGVDVDERTEFASTTHFFDTLQRLITGSPDVTIGAMYATETAAIFEHEVFLELSRELVMRKGLNWERSRLKAFHDLHLEGVEQSHKDGLALFLDCQAPGSVQQCQTFIGGVEAIDAMVLWWNSLLSRLPLEAPLSGVSKST